MNVLLQDDWKAKITDFGMAKIKVATETMSPDSNQKGSIRWRAPELMKRGGTHSQSSDVYSLGMVLWEIASRQLPFADEQSDLLVITFIKDGEKEMIPDDCPLPFAEIIQECWKAPLDRPDAKSIAAKLEVKTNEKIFHDFTFEVTVIQYFSSSEDLKEKTISLKKELQSGTVFPEKKATFTIAKDHNLVLRMENKVSGA